MPIWPPKQKPAIDWAQSINRGLISRSLTDSIRAAELVDGGLLTYYDVGGAGIDAKFRGTDEGGALWFNENDTRVAGAILLEHLGEDPLHEAEDLTIHVRVKGNDSTQVINEDNLFGQWITLQGGSTTSRINLRWDSNSERFELEWKSGNTRRDENATLSGFGHTQFCERFHDIVLTFTAMTPRLYVDGVLVNTFTQHTPGIGTGEDSVSAYLEILGGHKTTGTVYSDAPRVDCVGYGVWNRGLTAGEVAQITEQGRHYGLSSAANDPNVVFTPALPATTTAPVWLPPYTDLARALQGWPDPKLPPLDKVGGVKTEGLWRELIFAASPADRDYVGNTPFISQFGDPAWKEWTTSAEYGRAFSSDGNGLSGGVFNNPGEVQRRIRESAAAGSEFTIVARSKVDASGGWIVCIPFDYDTTWDPPYIHIAMTDSSRRPSFFWARSSSNFVSKQSTNQIITYGEWHTYAITFNSNSNQMRFYLDGVFDNSVGFTEDPITSIARSNPGPVCLHGRGDKISGENRDAETNGVLMWSRALSDAEIAEVQRNFWGFAEPANDPSVVFTQSGAGGSTQSITADAVAVSTSVYEPTLGVGEISIAADAVASATTVYEATIEPGAVAIAADFIASATSVYEATVLAGGAVVEADFVSDSTSVYEATLNPGAVSISAEFIADATTVYEATAQAAAGAGEIVADFVLAGTSVHEPTLVPGSVTTVADLIAAGTIVYEPALSSTVSISADFAPDSTIVYEPTLAPGVVSIAADAIPSVTTVYEPLFPFDQELVMDYIPAQTALYEPLLFDPALTWTPVAAASTAWTDSDSSSTNWTEVDPSSDTWTEI